MTTIASIIMPALNEASCIMDVIDMVPLEEFSAREIDTEIIVVDNGSVDGTGDLARKAGARVIYEPRRGYGYAYLMGFAEAKGDIICTLDADGTYPVHMLPELTDMLLEENLDFINTNRFPYMHNGVMSRSHRAGNAILTFANRALFRLPFHDSQSGMWVFRSELLKRMQLRAVGMALSQEIKIEAACRLGVRCAEVPIQYDYRLGESKLRAWRDGISNLTYLFRKQIK
ncbi:glycosyltransferase family 2 protein [Chloroflexota bacterium]